MAEHTTEGVSFVDDPTGTLYRRESGMTQPVWCGLCSGYGDHDTAHHGSNGLIPGDLATIVGISDTLPASLQMFRGRSGRVEQVRGNDVTIALSGRRGGTDTITVDRKYLVPQ